MSTTTSVRPPTGGPSATHPTDDRPAEMPRRAARIDSAARSRVERGETPSTRPVAPHEGDTALATTAPQSARRIVPLAPTAPPPRRLLARRITTLGSPSYGAGSWSATACPTTVQVDAVVTGNSAHRTTPVTACTSHRSSGRSSPAASATIQNAHTHAGSFGEHEPFGCSAPCTGTTPRAPKDALARIRGDNRPTARRAVSESKTIAVARASACGATSASECAVGSGPMCTRSSRRHAPTSAATTAIARPIACIDAQHSRQPAAATSPCARGPRDPAPSPREDDPTVPETSGPTRKQERSEHGAYCARGNASRGDR